MTEIIGFDRLIDATWLDLTATSLARSGDPEVAYSETWPVVQATTGDHGASEHATRKSMTVVGRIWLRVPAQDVALRDRAASTLADLPPGDRIAVHWAMSELAYPFYLDACGVAGRALSSYGVITVATLRSRLSERWGARAVLPLAARKVLGTWIRWGVVTDGEDRNTYNADEPVAIGDVAAGIVAVARVKAEPAHAVSLDDLQHSPDLFPFRLPDLRPILQQSPDVQLHREGGNRWVVRAIL
jgi:hypothetical protein